MLLISLLLLCVYICKVTSSLDHFNTEIKSCHIGDVVRNDCNICLCTSKSIFKCIAVPCSAANAAASNEDDFLQTCAPNRLYVQNMITCVCSNDGRWPHRRCAETFQSLPPENIEIHKCKPNTYAIVDCNVCRCGPDGKLINNRCTRNNCADNAYIDPRRYNIETIIKKNSVYSNCKAKNWYSFAPCQFCYCVNENKLVCNTGNNFNNNLTVDKYDLQLCGKELIREALELVPSKDKLPRASFNSSKMSEEDFSNTDPVSAEVNNVIVNKGNIETIGTTKGNDDIDELNQTYKEEIDATDSQEDQNKLFNTLSPAIATNNSDVPEVSQEIKSTRQPDFNKYSSSDESGDDYDDYSNEITVDMESSPTPRNINNTKSSHSKKTPVKTKINDGQKDVEDLEYSGNTLKINVPNMLNRVFEMALRKSMVSLSEKTACIPGTTSTKQCNMCFCLKIGKLLCTNNKC